ncbi:ATP-dependent protease ATPase subunit HslU [Porphyridium purpureum]|uniref:ATP-dependent protease ATPase subunit HslU n=1 Tax=Porphyridium purpureum TaxID=35688 RepID=A0A5J4YZG1_PORPP|nr:ATP-dependent protease ATPase subunit HslU [Porphyridium purpureum]|eukprot:POR9781..scf208_2
MAIALRNRWRRKQLPEKMRDEVMPKNMLMIGPTGVGKTEIARRLAKLVDAPFIKVEATKFTEVGFHGRDVDQIIRDLLENGISLVKQRHRRKLKAQLERQVEDRLLDELAGVNARDTTRDSFRTLLRNGDLEDREIEIEESSRPKVPHILQDVTPGQSDVLRHLDKMLTVSRSGGTSGNKRLMSVKEARTVLEEGEAEKLINDDAILRQAIEATEQDGIVFIDEIDKICTPSGYRHGADASSEGVQRDLLPLIEGSIINTKRGNINTDHILFVASGAFHACKPSDLMAELQGRLPIRVELKGLTEEDMFRILTVPETNLVQQHIELMRTEGVTLIITDSALREIARVAAEVNRNVENIGARRLHTVLERILEQVSFNAPEMKGQTITIDTVDVKGSLSDMLMKTDLTKYVL